VHEVAYTLPEDRIKRKMTHTTKEKEKQKLLTRIRRIRGQLDAVERALEEEAGCSAILQQITACRGALDGLIAELVEDHIREHVMDQKAARNNPRARAAEELVEIVHSFLT
jgi:DNA-binding FrmR family transcriptional regulator